MLFEVLVSHDVVSNFKTCQLLGLIASAGLNIREEVYGLCQVLMGAKQSTLVTAAANQPGGCWYGDT